MAEMKNLTINGTQFTLPFAPAGYGLGGNAADISGTNLNDSIGNGFFKWSTATNAPFDWGYMQQIQAGEATIQIAHSITHVNGYYDVTVIRKKKNWSEWGEWEYDNPPMALGVEYRTTERWNGKPVYAVLVNCGALPANSSKTVNICSYATTPVRAEWSIVNTSNPLRYSDISHAGATNNFYSSASDGITAVVINATSNLSGFNAVLAYYYTKD